jgi:predicted ATPase
MIRNIIITNFKSILEDDIALKDLSVIIGANGTGKSNLIKALDFLAVIADIGLVAAVNKFGGYNGIIPKAIPPSEVKKTHIKFKYTLELPPPVKKRENVPNFTVDHKFELGYSPTSKVRVINESLVFHKVLLMAELLEETLSKLNIESSSFELKKGARLITKYNESPHFSEENLNHYIEWLGLPFQSMPQKSASNLHSTLKYLERFLRKNARESQTFIDPSRGTIIDYSQHYGEFLSTLKNTRRYDLILSELRKEQQVTESSTLASIGTNMPSVFRYLLSRSDSQTAINRIKATLGEISPYIDSFNNAQVRTGKEFLEFLESTTTRSVESWESSDGTLRTIAILLALETQREYSTILIEEPEQNLHPWAIRSMLDHIRQVIQERKLQVIITTHSQQVLEMAHPDEVLVATRSKEEGTKFRTLSDIVPNAKIEIGEIGRMWVKGLLGGVPSVD